MSTRIRSRASAAPGPSNSTPTPRPSGSRRPHHSSAGRASTPPLPEYEPLSAPLNPSAQRALTALLESKSLRDLKKHLQAAGERLTETGGEVNERTTDAMLRLERDRLRGQPGAERRKKNKGKGKENVKSERERDVMEEDEVAEEEEEEEEEDDEDEDEEMDDVTEANKDPNYEEKARKLTQFNERVTNVTSQLDEKVREMIDAEAQLDGLTSVLKDIEKEATQNQEQAGAARRSTRRTRQARDEEDTEMVDANDDEDNENSEYEDRAETPAYGEGKPTLLQTLEEKLTENDSQWKSQSLTQRYSKNNTYIGFYRMIFEAKHPGDEIPPLPHPSTWFSHLEEEERESTLPASTFTSPLPQRTRNPNASASNRNPRQRVPDNEDNEEADVAIERERISLKCPLTLLPFQDPVTSTRCPHSFERLAIEDMIKRSSTTIPDPNSVQQGTSSRRGGGGGGKRIKCVECPVCSVQLTLNDLRRDPVLLRRVRRAEAALMQRDADDQLDPEGARRRRLKGGRQSGFTVASGGASGDEGDDGEGEDDDIVDDDDDEDEASCTASMKRERASRSRERHGSSSSEDGDHDEDEVEDV